MRPFARRGTDRHGGRRGSARTRAVAALFGALLSGAAEASTERYRIAPYKDDLFKYQRVLAEQHGGDFVIIEFDTARDIGGRDEIELKKAFDKFVSLDVNESKKDLTLGTGPDAVRYMAVGKVEGGAKMVTIFLHGQHGDRSLAMEDHRFGGNFNRLKNLMVENDGVYISPDFIDFFKDGSAQMKRLIEHQAELSPEAPIVIGCASTGCKIVYRLLEDPEVVKLLDGIVLLGALPLGTRFDDTFFNATLFKDPNHRIAIYIGHGSNDKTVSWVTHELVFKQIKRRWPDYPIRYELFRSPDAVHGTPLRMMDWRLVLNWILEENGT